RLRHRWRGDDVVGLRESVPDVHGADRACRRVRGGGRQAGRALMAFSINRRTARVTAVAAALPIPRVRAADDGLPGWKPMGVSEAESRTLAAACERILPPTATPGAAAFGVPQFVARAVASWCSAEEARAFRAGLAQLEAAARSTFGVSFAAATAAQQDALLTAAQAEAEQALARG